MKLTKKVIEALPFPSSGQKFIWDDEIKGFGIRLTPGKKTYIVQGRVRGKGNDRRLSLGEHGVFTLDEARKRARKELSAMLDGTDPIEEKKRIEAHSVTLEQLVKRYLEDRRDLKESSRADIEKHLNKSFEAWAERPFIEITREKVAVKFRELSERSNAQANQAFRILRALMNYARASYREGSAPIILENPVSILSDAKLWNRIQARSGKIPINKIGAVWNAVQEIRNAPDQTRVGEVLADAVIFLLLTGARWSEMAELTWDRINLKECSWYLPDPKNRNPVTFPLPAAAVEILEKRKAKKGFVFPSWSSSGHIREARGILEKISKQTGGRVTPHDLRRTFRAIAGECGIEFWKTKLLMGHKISGDVTITHYTETSDLRYLAPEINRIGDWITKSGILAASDNVVPIRRAK